MRRSAARSLLRDVARGEGARRSPGRRSDAAAALADLPSPRDGDGARSPTLLGGGGGATGPPLKLRYRDQVINLDRDWSWFADYVADVVDLIGEANDAETDLVTSRADALDLLWARFRSRAVGSAADYHGLLGCYNLHRGDFEGQVYLFWSNGWGAPHRAFLYTAQLARTFVDHADLSGVNPAASVIFSQCEGFVDFLRDMLDRSATTRSDDYVAGSWSSTGRGPCTFRVEYRNTDSRYPALSGPACSMASDVGCHAGFDAEGSDPDCRDVPRWDAQPLTSRSLASDGTPFYCLTGNLDKWGCDPPLKRCSHSGLGGEWRVLLAPSDLYFRGATLDYEMFLARLAWDRALTVASEGDLARALELAEVASRIARYALRVLASQAQLLIHEIGHVYLGAHHCEGGKHCCFVVASLAWLCRVRADLGLPASTYEPAEADDGGDYDAPPSATYTVCEHCGSTDRMPFSCDTVHAGVPGNVAEVFGTSCYNLWGLARNGCLEREE